MQYQYTIRRCSATVFLRFGLDFSAVPVVFARFNYILILEDITCDVVYIILLSTVRSSRDIIRLLVLVPSSGSRGGDLGEISVWMIPYIDHIYIYTWYDVVIWKSNPRHGVAAKSAFLITRAENRPRECRPTAFGFRSRLPTALRAESGRSDNGGRSVGGRARAYTPLLGEA